MRVGRFEKSVAIQLGRVRRDLIDDLINQFPPPAFVVVLAGAVDGRTRRPFLPAGSESPIEGGGVERQADLSATSA